MQGSGSRLSPAIQDELRPRASGKLSLLCWRLTLPRCADQVFRARLQSQGQRTKSAMTKPCRVWPIRRCRPSPAAGFSFDKGRATQCSPSMQQLFRAQTLPRQRQRTASLTSIIIYLRWSDPPLGPRAGERNCASQAAASRDSRLRLRDHHWSPVQCADRERHPGL